MAKIALLVAAAFPLGYVVFWGTYLSSLAARISGPIYLVPLYGVVCMLAASAIDHWWDRRRGIALGVLAVLAVGTIPGAVTRFDVNREISEQQVPWTTSVVDLPGPSLVFVADTGSYLLYANPFSSNGPDLDDQVLYASAGSSRMLDLIADQPARDPYLQQASVPSQELGPREDPYPLGVRLVPIEVVRGAALQVEIAIRPPRGTEVVELTVDTGADRRRETLTVDDVELRARVVLGGEGEGALAMGDRGRVTVTARFADVDDELSGTPVRRVTPYRTVGSDLEVVSPVEAQRFERLGARSREWRFVTDASELTLAVTSPAG
jgi:hypothetical protein